MTALFVVCLILVAHAYLVYPLSLAALRLVAGRERHRTDGATPRISLVISAYNEESVLAAKIENSLALDYPEGAIERVVVSDGSTDRTNAIAGSYAGRGVELRAFPGRRGKVACLNDVVPVLKGDIVVMSDANSMYDPGSIRALVRHFADPRIGCVSGRLRYVNPGRLPAGEGESLYWRYEGAVKRLESDLGRLLGANGAIYAYRRELFRPVDPLLFCDDVIPIRILLGGHLVIEDPAAGCTEQASGERVERARRRRHASFGLRSMAEVMREAIRRHDLLVLYQCLSHRVLRWMGWIAVLGAALATPGLPPPWRTAAAAAQAAVYACAAAGWLASRLTGRAPRPLYLPFYFLLVTWAGFLGFAALVRGTDRPWWEPRK